MSDFEPSPIGGGAAIDDLRGRIDELEHERDAALDILHNMRKEIRATGGIQSDTLGRMNRALDGDIGVRQR